MSIELFIIKIINVLRRLSMNIYNLRYFVTLARIRQYTKAAEELCITQPSLSHAISQMEKELGVKLFEKNGLNSERSFFLMQKRLLMC